jgi:hypothetical protein
MTETTIEQRVTGLEELVKPLVPLPGRVKDLETYAGPGQNAGFAESLIELRKDFKAFGKVQAKQTSLLERQTARLWEIRRDTSVFAAEMSVLKTDMRDFKEEVSGRLDILEVDVADLKTDVTVLKTDVAELKTDVAGLKTDMTQVKGTLAEILDRLPPKAA